MTTELLRIAIPNKGSLSQSASEILREAGYKQRTDAKQLTLTDSDNGVEFFYLRPRDIALYVGEGTLDIGITGRDLLLDSGAKAEEVLALGFGRSRFRFAAPPGTVNATADLSGKRIATSYDGVVRRYLEERGIDATVTRLDGAVETSVQLGVADVIADVVETGSTLRQAGLEVVGEPILESEAVLVTRAGATLPTGFEIFRRRLEGVLVARSYVMMDYDIPAERVEQAVALTPGIESPTVSPLHREGWVAVRSMVRRDAAQRVMDELYELGARGILSTDIHACRL
jgi:ATP phosphoribosyltransferase